MNKIEFDRLGVDGIIRTKNKVESEFCNYFEGKISDNLDLIIANGYEKILLDMIKRRLHQILIAPPETIFNWLIIVDRYRHLLARTVTYPQKNVKNVTMTLSEALFRSFNYKYFRSSDGLRDLAKMLNVKTCPYCNMHFTLYAENTTGQVKFAEFEYDHFFDKQSYPMFSMSLYNLIPSCRVCNHSKTPKKLSLAYHPYYSSIHRNFFFEVNDVLELLYGKNKADKFSINLVSTGNSTEFAAYEDNFHLQALYARHRDIAKEVFDKAYLYAYYRYGLNFKFIPPFDYAYLKRLWLGTYTDEKDIEKRPMTKFNLDLEQQAFAILLSDDK